MKSNFFYIIFLLLFICNSSYAQVIQIKDNTEEKLIQEIEIELPDTETKFNLQSSKGFFNITEIKDSIFTIKIKGKEAIRFDRSKFTKDTLVFKTEKKMIELEEVVVTASKFNEKIKDISRDIKIIKSEDITFQNSGTSADVIQNTGTAFVQRSQGGGGSIVLRGFEANRILMVVDGIRMNNGIYRGGHLQNIITIDQQMLDRIEIINGPGVVVYGSDGLGGVVHLVTKKPILNSEDRFRILGNLGIRNASAAFEKNFHTDINISNSKFASLSSFTYSDFGDLRMGSDFIAAESNNRKNNNNVSRLNNTDSIINNQDPLIQKNSGYYQYDLLQKFLYAPTATTNHTINIQFSNSSNIHRYDRLSERSSGKPKFAEYYYGPQFRLQTAYQLNKQFSKESFIQKWNLDVGYQKIKESRHSRRLNKKATERRFENLDIYFIQTDIEKRIKKHEIRFGGELYLNDIKSSAYAEDLMTSARTIIDSRYPDGSNYFVQSGIYIAHSWEISKKLILNDGLRYSFTFLDSKIQNNILNLPVTQVVQRHHSLSGQLGINYLPGEKTKIRFVLSTGYRAPNVDDLSKIFESVTGNIIVPNSNLQSEQAYSADLGFVTGIGKNFKLQANAYFSLLNNLITTGNYQYNGADSILYNGQMSAVSANINLKEAYITGGDIEIGVRFATNFMYKIGACYTYGRIVNNNREVPLDHIPPLIGRSSLSFTKKSFEAEFYVLFHGQKHISTYRLNAEDNENFASSYGTPAWYTFNLKLSYTIKDRVQLMAGAENIADQNYRIFASGISGPGRNIYLALRYKF